LPIISIQIFAAKRVDHKFSPFSAFGKISISVL